MNNVAATAAQWIGKATVLLAVLLLIWSFYEANRNGVPARPVSVYLSILASSAGIAVSGMLAVSLGMLLERFTNA